MSTFAPVTGSWYWFNIWTFTLEHFESAAAAWLANAATSVTPARHR